MRDTLYSYLLERPAGASPRELLDLIFTQPGTDAEFGTRFLRLLLEPDRRFFYRTGEDRWIAREHETLATPIEAARFVVVDLETTGGSAGTDAITEIGAVALVGGRIEGEFQQLVRPAVAVQPFVARLTGITDEMLADQPPLREVLPRFLDFAGDGVLIAHNARFDIGFLDAAARRHLGRALHQPHLCTIRLARRLLPAVKRRSLDSLVGHFGLLVRDRHRALQDARATADVFLALIELGRRRGVARLDQLLDLQHQAVDGRRFVCHLPPARVQELPAAPGVYRFLSEDGRILYVGRAVDLRQRVGSYLYNSSGHNARTLDLIRHIRSVEVTRTGSALSAALLEAELIRSLKPPYNKLSKHLPRLAYLKLGNETPFARLSVVNRPGSQRARFYGPFRNRAGAERVRDVLLRLFQLRSCSGRLQPDPGKAPCFLGQIDMCAAPCAAGIDAETYEARTEQLVTLLEGDPAAAREELVLRREAHSAALRFEAAARAQRDLETIERFTRRSRTLGWVVRRQSFLVLLPSVLGDVEIYIAIAGRLVRRATLMRREDLEEISVWLAANWDSCQSRRVQREDVEATAILAGWMRSRGERDGHLIPLAGPAVDTGELALVFDSMRAHAPLASQGE